MVMNTACVQDPVSAAKCTVFLRVFAQQIRQHSRITITIIITITVTVTVTVTITTTVTITLVSDPLLRCTEEIASPGSVRIKEYIAMR